MAGPGNGIGLDPQRRSILIWMCVLIAVNQFGFGAIVPVMPLYADEFGVSETAIGFTIAIYGLARFLVNVPAGVMADRIGRRGALTVGGLLTVVGTLICAVAPEYWVLLIGRFIAGAGAACVLTAGQIVLADIASPANRGRVMAIYMGVFLFAVGAGAFPGGWLASTVSLESPFIAGAILAGTVTIIAWFALPETRDLYEDPNPARPSDLNAPAQSMLRRLAAIPGFVQISAVSFSSFFARTGGLFTIIPLLAKDKIGASASDIGLGLSMISVVGLVLVYPSGMIVDRFGRKRVIVPSMLLAGVAMLLYLQVTSVTTFLLASVVWSCATGVAGAAPAAYAADIAPRGMTASTMSWYRSISDSGYVMGPLLMGLIADLISPEAALVATSVLLVGVGISFALRAPESYGRPPAAEPTAAAVPET
ncbi:MAG: MFS transporter [Thermomicrobiales bacterium]